MPRRANFAAAECRPVRVHPPTRWVRSASFAKFFSSFERCVFVRAVGDSWTRGGTKSTGKVRNPSDSKVLGKEKVLGPRLK